MARGTPEISWLRWITNVKQMDQMLGKNESHAGNEIGTIGYLTYCRGCRMIVRFYLNGMHERQAADCLTLCFRMAVAHVPLKES